MYVFMARPFRLSWIYDGGEQWPEIVTDVLFRVYTMRVVFGDNTAFALPSKKKKICKKKMTFAYNISSQRNRLVQNM